MTAHYVSHDQIVEMVRSAAAEHGLTLRELYDQAHAPGEKSMPGITEPHLRDLWLIWGDDITEDDVDLDEHTATLSLRAPAPIDDKTFDRVMDRVMAGLCALSDIGVDASISSQRNQDIRIELTLGDGWAKRS